MGPIHTLDDFLDMLRRRAGLIMRVLLLGAILSILWALKQEHRYRSSETIQIELSKVANDLAPPTVEGSAARRLQLIEQQLLARRNLMDVIDKFSLFEGNGMRPEQKAKMLREAVSITGIAAARQGFADDGAISVLTITAELSSGELAQAVAHEFAQRTRAMAEAQRAEQTRDTLEFFMRKEENLLNELAKLEAELSSFRRENDLSIDGSIEFRRSEIASLNAAILTLDRDINAVVLARSQIDRSQREPTISRLESEYDAEIASLRTQRDDLENRREQMYASLETSPAIEKELANFQRRIGQFQRQLDIITERRNDAEVGYALEMADRGERLITLEEARVPDYPVGSGRRKRVLLGVLASIATALGVAFLLELRHPVIRSAGQMERETGLTPVASIPDIKHPRQLRRLRAARRFIYRAGWAARLVGSRQTWKS
jgi:uncharacterized protein involved in exopolysaccharide biosynthesis